MAFQSSSVGHGPLEAPPHILQDLKDVLDITTHLKSSHGVHASPDQAAQRGTSSIGSCCHLIADHTGNFSIDSELFFHAVCICYVFVVMQFEIVNHSYCFFSPQNGMNLTSYFIKFS